MAVEVHALVCWVMTPCALVGGYKRFCRTYSSHLQGRNTPALCLELPDGPVGTSLRVYISLFTSEEFLPFKKISTLRFPFNMLFMEYNYLPGGKWRTK